MQKNVIYQIAIIIALNILTACGGGVGGGTPVVTTATGQFKDGNISGITVESGGQTSITDQDGNFTYEVGNTVVFSIGGVTLGSTDGKAVITPIDLFPGSSTSTIEVQNIVRFLLMLDEDGNPDNGISISIAVQAIAANWSQINFSTTDLSTEIGTIMSDAIIADGGSHILPDPTSAKNHLNDTLLCSNSGAFKGTFSGGDNGYFAVMVDAKTGLVDGYSYSDVFQLLIELSGTVAVSLDDNAEFVSGDANTGATYTGSLVSNDATSGTWVNTFASISGSFTGDRVGSTSGAIYRYTGLYTGDDFGVITFEIDSSNNVTGATSSTLGADLVSLTGTLSGNTINAVSSDGAVISGIIDLSAGTMSGTWDDSTNSITGTYTGTGCKLN